MSNIPFQSNRVSLDQKGHCENASCTWAPPASPTNFNASSSTIESLTKDSPAREDLPPLYNLPNRSTHTYEDECRVHHGSGVCHRHHCEGAPRKEETQPQSKQTFQRTNSWNMEDQKRLQHMRLLGSANVQDTNPCDC